MTYDFAPTNKLSVHELGHHLVCYIILVGGWFTPLKNMKVNWDDDIPNIDGKIKFMPTKPPTSIITTTIITIIIIIIIIIITISILQCYII